MNKKHLHTVMPGDAEHGLQTDCDVACRWQPLLASEKLTVPHDLADCLLADGPSVVPDNLKEHDTLQRIDHVV